jgi:hypothetical protein
MCVWRYLPTSLHGITTHKTNINIINTVRNSNLKPKDTPKITDLWNNEFKGICKIHQHSGCPANSFHQGSWAIAQYTDCSESLQGNSTRPPVLLSSWRNVAIHMKQHSSC